MIAKTKGIFKLSINIVNAYPFRHIFFYCIITPNITLSITKVWIYLHELGMIKIVYDFGKNMIQILFSKILRLFLANKGLSFKVK